MTNKPYSSVYDVQQDYIQTVEKAANEIGIDRHQMRFRSETIDAAVVNTQIENMFKRGQEFVYGYKRFQALTIVSADLQQNDLEKYINETQKERINTYHNDVDLPEDTKSTDAAAQDILKDLHHAYNYGLKTGYDSHDDTLKKMPGDIFSKNIIRTKTGKLAEN